MVREIISSNFTYFFFLQTTLANVIKEILVQHGKKNGKPVRFTKLCATMAGVADVKEIINVAKNELRLFQKRTVLFMDEIHRFNKSQQVRRYFEEILWKFRKVF